MAEGCMISKRPFNPRGRTCSHQATHSLCPVHDTRHFDILFSSGLASLKANHLKNYYYIFVLQSLVHSFSSNQTIRHKRKHSQIKGSRKKKNLISSAPNLKKYIERASKNIPKNTKNPVFQLVGCGPKVGRQTVLIENVIFFAGRTIQFNNFNDCLTARKWGWFSYLCPWLKEKP